MIVENISEVFFFKENELINSPINLNKRQTEHLKGVFRMTRNESTLIIMLLNLEKLFTFEEQYKLKKLDALEEKAETDSKKLQTNIGILEFYIANERYAIKMSDTNEIIQLTDIVPIPKAPPYIKGIINLRGEVISVISLSLLVDNTEHELTKEAKVLIVKAGADVSGLLVEKVIGIRRVPPTLFEPPSDLLKQKGNIFIEGIGKIKETNEIVVLMDIETTLRQAQTETEKLEDEEDYQAVLRELEQLERQGETVQ
jgi:purine-binding chemotaxis protein CheW